MKMVPIHQKTQTSQAITKTREVIHPHQVKIHSL